jgi:hypothetical protein
MNYSGADWIARQKYGANISPFGREVADILGGFAKGIYHMNGTSLSKADWQNESFIEVTVQGELSTFDGSGLTLLVLLAHDRGVRVGVKGAAPGYVRLRFLKPSESSTMPSAHPSLSVSTERLRKLIGHEVRNP